MLLRSKGLISLFVGVFIIILSVASFAATVTYTYDSLNRITKVDYGNGFTEEYTYDSAGNRLSLTVSSSGISVLPTSHNFGSVNVGSTSTPQTFTISNTGIADLVIGTISITGADASEFSKQNDTCSGQTVASNGSCTFDVVFSPTSAGAKSANLVISSNDYEKPIINVSLTGTGVLPLTIGYSPTSFSFNATYGGSNPPNQSLIISNTGGGTLSWSVSGDAAWLNLSPASGTDNGTVTASIDIAGLTAGTYNATITITASGATNSPVEIPVILIVEAADTTPPTSTITSPINGAVIINTTYIIKGTASDIGTGIQKVEVSTDGGTTWNLATGITSWSYAWTIPADGTYTIKSRTTDTAGNVETPSAGVTVTVSIGLDIHLKKGFNLISAPTNTSSVPDAYTFLGLIDSSGTTVERILRYNRSVGTVQEAYYDENGNAGGDNFPMVAGEGLVVYVKEDMDIEESQNICTAFNENLRPGINWIGTPCQPDIVSAFSLLQAIGDETVVSSIQRFNPDTGLFESAGYLNGAIAGLDFPIKAGEGYFVFMR